MAAVSAIRGIRDGQAAFDRRFALLQDLDAENRTGASELGPAVDEMASFNLSARKLMYNTDVDKVFTFDQATSGICTATPRFGNACITARNLLRAKLGHDSFRSPRRLGHALQYLHAECRVADSNSPVRQRLGRC